ncbi:hypothetical protein D4R99_02530 [bacterium]|nr:MAG: hypothetical protein D4R99_02530 [bacterium]
MAEIIQFSGIAKKQGRSRSLTDFLREALNKIEEMPLLQNCFVTDRAKFKRLMEARIMRGIIQKREISTASFLCGLYSAEVLTKFLRTVEEDLGRISQLEGFAKTGNPYFYQTAGDHLFYICAVFPENADRLRRQLKLQDYHQMGARCYYTFYDLTGVEIGYHMSRQFTQMTGIIRQYVINPKK